MTITMGKLAAALALALVAAPPALAQLKSEFAPEEKDEPRRGWRFTPTIELRETWTSNVGLARDADAQSQFISEVAPGFLLDYSSPRVQLRSRMELHYYGMKDRSASGANRTSRLAVGDLRARLAGDWLFLDASGNISQQGVSPFGQRVFDNGYSSVNRAEVTTWRVSPYLKQRFGKIATSELRYTRDSVTSDRNTGFGDSQSDTLSARLQSGSALRSLGWSVNYLRQHLNDSLGRESNIETLDSRLSWRLSHTLALSAGAGYDNYDYNSVGGKTEGRSWMTGVNWTPSRRTSVNAEVGHRFYGPSKRLSVLHRSRHTVWNINYDDSVTNSRNEYLLEATPDTAGLLDRLFQASYSDRAERQSAVENYIRNAGLPPVLYNNVSFFSNRFFLQRQLRASGAVRFARTSAILSLYNVRRDALSSRDTDTVLLANSFQIANDNVTQKGGSLALNYRYSPRTTLSLIHDRARSDSRSAVFSTHNQRLSLSARYTGPKGTSGALQLRRVSGTTATGVAASQFSYSENAISAIFYMQL